MFLWFQACYQIAILPHREVVHTPNLLSNEASLQTLSFVSAEGDPAVQTTPDPSVISAPFDAKTAWWQLDAP